MKFSSRAFLELAARVRPKMTKPILKRASDREVAESQRRKWERFKDPYDDHIRAAQAQPEVYGHGMLNYVDSTRSTSGDPAPGGRPTIPGHKAADGSDDHGW